LWDCRKLKHKKLGLRVIFRQSSEGIEIIEIVVIGKREDDEAYKTAIERLGRNLE
jgi:mRNA interferase RelE/StbE